MDVTSCSGVSVKKSSSPSNRRFRRCGWPLASRCRRLRRHPTRYRLRGETRQIPALLHGREGKRDMKHASFIAVLLAATALISGRHAYAGQAPFGTAAPDIPVSHNDRVYSADQYSNTVSVTDPASNKLLGAIHLGNESPSSLSPLY